MNDIEMVIEASKRLEGALMRRYGADGRGLTEKVESVQDRVSAKAIEAIRYVAEQRNKLVHEESYVRLSAPARFRKMVEFALQEIAPDDGVAVLTPRPAERCPACHFSYGWRGGRCDHCGY